MDLKFFDLRYFIYILVILLFGSIFCLKMFGRFDFFANIVSNILSLLIIHFRHCWLEFHNSLRKVRNILKFST